MSKLVAVLNQLLALILKHLKNQKNSTKEQEVNKANEDPTSWFNSHFNSGADSMRDTDNNNTDTSEQTKNNSQ